MLEVYKNVNKYNVNVCVKVGHNIWIYRVPFNYGGSRQVSYA